jgi:hypothetical protein
MIVAVFNVSVLGDCVSAGEAAGVEAATGETKEMNEICIECTADVKVGITFEVTFAAEAGVNEVSTGTQTDVCC